MQVVFQWSLSSGKGRSIVSFKGHLSSKGVFHQRLSSIKVSLLSKVIFHWRSSSNKLFLCAKFQTCRVYFHLVDFCDGSLCSPHTTYFSKNLYLLTMTDRQADTNGQKKPLIGTQVAALPKVRALFISWSIVWKQLFSNGKIKFFANFSQNGKIFKGTI